MTRIATTAIVLLLAVLGAPGVHADGKPESALPPRAVTHHSMMLGGHRVDYDAIAEALPLTDRTGTSTASIFTVSYLVAAPGGAPRPVSFVVNGGPGAASVFLHLGALGQKVLDTPADGDAPTRSAPATAAARAATKIPTRRSGTSRPTCPRSTPLSGYG
jgi:hypothetical protein